MRVGSGPIRSEGVDGRYLFADRELSQGEVEFIHQCIEMAGQTIATACYVEWTDEGGPIIVGWRYKDGVTLYQTTVAANDATE